MTAPADNIYDALAFSAERFGDTDFLVVDQRREVLGFRGLAAAADVFGRALAGLGVGPGERVALWMTNQADWAVAAFGAARAGAVLVGVNTRLTAREVAHMLVLTRPKVWILEETFLSKINAAEAIAPVLAACAAANLEPPTIVLRRTTGPRQPGMLDWDEVVGSAAEAADLPPAANLVARGAESGFAELVGVAAILSTSGTTAAPKGVMLTHAGLLRLGRACAERQELTPGERFYSVGPFFHCSGYMHGLLTNLQAGSTFFTAQKFEPAAAWDVIVRERITCYHGSIVPLQEMERLAGFDRRMIPRFTRAWYSAPAVEMARLEEVFGTRMCEVYGLTETGGNIAICRASDPLAMRHDSDGRPQDGLEVRIVDPAGGQRLAEGTPGEICVRGWNVMRGYFRDSDATGRAIDAEDWLHTGDQGMRLPDGFIKFLSRLKDVIRVGGENLSPLEVEEVLMAHPGVREAAVVAAPHPRLGEVPVAFVVPQPGVPVTDADLAAHCARQLANFKVPRRFVLVEDLPRSSAVQGRVAKIRLREMLLNKPAEPAKPISSAAIP